jgi:hypothetical protein
MLVSICSPMFNIAPYVLDIMRTLPGRSGNMGRQSRRGTPMNIDAASLVPVGLFMLFAFVVGLLAVLQTRWCNGSRRK